MDPFNRNRQNELYIKKIGEGHRTEKYIPRRISGFRKARDRKRVP